LRKTIIACDWLEKFGGAESVLKGIIANLQSVEVNTLWNSGVEFGPSVNIDQSFLSKTDLFKQKKQLGIPFMDFYWRTRKVFETDFVLASSHLSAHHIKGNPESGEKFAYVHSPARYLWAPEVDKRGNSRMHQTAAPVLKAIDRKYSKEITNLVANSQFIRRRINDAWGMDSRVIYPPVNTRFYSAEPTLDSDDKNDDAIRGMQPGFLLCFSRFVPYKKFEDAVELAAISGNRIVIAGSGEIYPALERALNRNLQIATVIVCPTNEQLRRLYSMAKALLFLGVEDFGIVPVESMAAGTPVIGLGQGGLLETVVHESTGYLMDKLDIYQFENALKAVDSCSPADCVAQAKKFSQEHFVSEVRSWLPKSVLTDLEVRNWS
jgi:glycosyltransferase involved in cell wall biosynthesis